MNGLPLLMSTRSVVSSGRVFRETIIYDDRMSERGRHR